MSIFKANYLYNMLMIKSSLVLEPGQGPWLLLGLCGGSSFNSQPSWFGKPVQTVLIHISFLIQKHATSSPLSLLAIYVAINKLKIYH